MPLSWPDSPAWQALAAPLRDVLDQALSRLDLRPAVLPPVIAATGAVGLRPEGIALDPGVLGPGARTPADDEWAETHPSLAGLALDRWRRAAGLVLEGIVLAGIAERTGGDPPRTWWTLGAAAEVVDRVAPELGWLWPEAADLLLHPEIGLSVEPRRAGWLFRWMRRAGRPFALGARPELDEAAWTAFGAWLEDRVHGPEADIPVPLPRGQARVLDDIAQPPLSHVRVRLAAPAAGAMFHLPAGPCVLAGGQVVEILVGCLVGGPLALRRAPLFPLGRWVLAGGTVAERAGAARGIEFTIFEDGTIDLVFADAFAGPPTPYLLGLAKQLGVSGSGRGSFRVTEAHGPDRGTLVFDELVPEALTVHPRLSSRFALPAETILGPVNKALEAMVGVPWAFALSPEGVRLEARLFGADTVLRLERCDDR